MGVRISSDRKRRRRGAPSDDQGIAPSIFFEPRKDSRGARKVDQLCREVERTLSYALGSFGDVLLSNLVVVGVEPAPDGSRLLVTLSPSGQMQNDLGVLTERVEAVRGSLRAEVAMAIQRKRTPELAFQVIPRVEPEGEP